MLRIILQLYKTKNDNIHKSEAQTIRRTLTNIEWLQILYYIKINL